MLKLIEPRKCKLIFGAIYSSEKTYKRIKTSLIKLYGQIDFESAPIPFNYSEYYREEMGSDLKRKFISFKKLIHPDTIVDIKLRAVKTEKRTAIVKRRRINLDPGYLTEAKLVLSTTKDFSHRIYLRKRIFAEVTLLYKNKTFKNLPWTFPDYKTKSYKDIFLKIRDLYRRQIKEKA